MRPSLVSILNDRNIFHGSSQAKQSTEMVQHLSYQCLPKLATQPLVAALLIREAKENLTMSLLSPFLAQEVLADWKNHLHGGGSETDLRKDDEAIGFRSTKVLSL